MEQIHQSESHWDDPNYPVKDWQAEVANEWVQHQKESNDE